MVKALQAAKHCGAPSRYQADQRVRLPAGHAMRGLCRPGMWDAACTAGPRYLKDSYEVRTAGREVERLRAEGASKEAVKDKEMEKGVKMVSALFRLPYAMEAKVVERLVTSVRRACAVPSLCLASRQCARIHT